MKIVVFNGSPRKGGNTEIMVNAFAKAAEAQKHTVCIVNVAAMNIHGCLGCGYCWKHQGECVQKDDMGKVFAELADADMLVFAAPIYWFDMSAQLKTAIDRLYAGGSTGFSFHKTALLLNAGADRVFDAAVAQYKAMTAYLKWEDMGIVLAPNMEKKGSMLASKALEEVAALAKRL